MNNEKAISTLHDVLELIDEAEGGIERVDWYINDDRFRRRYEAVLTRLEDAKTEVKELEGLLEG